MMESTAVKTDLSAIEYSQVVVAIQLVVIVLLVIFATVAVERVCYYRRLVKSFRRAMERQTDEVQNRSGWLKILPNNSGKKLDCKCVV